MKRVTLVISATIFAAFLAVPAVAAPPEHTLCDAGTTVVVGNLGAMNEMTLQQRIDAIEAQLSRVQSPRRARGSRVAQRHELKNDLALMQTAMDDLHTKMYRNGCEAALQTLPLKTRLTIVEHELAQLQQATNRSAAGGK